MAVLDARYRQALAAGRDRDYHRSIELLTEVLAHAEADRYPQALLYLGRSYHAVGDFSRAVQTLHGYQSLHPDSGPAHFFLGRSFLALGMHRHARTHLQRSIAIHPQFAPAHSLLGVSYLRRRETEAALQSFATALQLAPEHEPTRNAFYNARIVHAMRLFFRGELEAAIGFFEAALADGRDVLVPHLYLARAYRELGDVEAALRHLDQAARLAPQDPSLPVQRAILLSLAGEPGAALAEIAKVGKLAQAGVPVTTDPVALLRVLTLVLFREGRYREALFYGRKYLREDFGDADVHFVMAESHRNLGATRKALNHLDRAGEADPARLDVRYARVLAMWERRRFRRALRELTRIRRLAPNDQTVDYYEALCRHELKQDPQRVVPLLQEQLRRRGADLPLMTALAQQYVRIELPDLARGWLERGLGMKGDHAPTLLALLEVYASLGAHDRLRATFTRYLSLFEDDLDVRTRFADFLYEQELWEHAAEQLVRLTPYDPDNDELQVRLAHCYQNARRYAEAVILLRELFSHNLDSDALLTDLLDCLDRSRNRRYAIELLKKVLARNPERPFHSALGRLLLRDGQLEAAAVQLREAVGVVPDDWQAYHHLGMAYQKMGNDEFAQRFLERARKVRAKGRRKPDGSTRSKQSAAQQERPSQRAARTRKRA